MYLLFFSLFNCRLVLSLEKGANPDKSHMFVLAY